MAPDVIKFLDAKSTEMESIYVSKIIRENDDILLKNQVVMQEMFKLNSEKNEKPKVYLATYGCQMNEHDSEKLLAMAHRMGYEETDQMDDARLILFNTCAVRENAELKVYGNLGRAKTVKEKSPDTVIGVCGCMMQQPHVVEEIKARYRYVDLVFGTHNVHVFPSLLHEALDGSESVIDVWDVDGQVIEDLPVDRKFDTRAYVNIMYGCNNFCTYCIVPYTRGRERSRTPEDILAEVRTLVEGGVKEVTLLGQNVNSYGKTLEVPLSFAGLLEQVNAVEGLDRIRFMTSHPKDISRELIETMARLPKLCHHLHLPIQAGSDALLAAMNRRYTVEAYRDKVAYARELMPDLTLTTDLIVGFPGETNEDFENTLETLSQIRYDAAFTFLYSPREGTPAATHEGQIPEALKKERFDRLLDRVNEIVREKNAARVGQVHGVLVENLSRKEGYVLGRTGNHITVQLPGDESLIGRLITVRITGSRGFSLSGVPIETQDVN